jgi:hypothetical protein
MLDFIADISGLQTQVIRRLGTEHCDTQQDIWRQVSKKRQHGLLSYIHCILQFNRYPSTKIGGS